MRGGDLHAVDGDDHHGAAGQGGSQPRALLARLHLGEDGAECALAGSLQRVRMAKRRRVDCAVGLCAAQPAEDGADCARAVKGAAQIPGVVPVMRPFARLERDKLAARKQS